MKDSNGVEPVLSEHFPDLRPPDERTALIQRLDYYRRGVIYQIEAVDDAAASSHVLEATNLTMGGIVKHLAWVEDHWFQARMLGVDLPEPWASAPLAEDREWPFHSARRDSVASLIDLYSEACDRSRAAADSFETLDAIAAAPSFGKGPVNLRWILVHMIDETACHTGHLDLLRDAVVRGA
jgi:uncharacterized damage-inducible protein DinB